MDPLKSTRRLKWRDNAITIHRKILDTIILEEITHSSEISLKYLIDVIRKDQAYLKTWEKWYSIKKSSLTT